MPATPFDSLHLSALFPAGDVARLFSDSAEIRAMMLVHGSLALAQGEAGQIPLESAKALHRASLELQIDPSGLAASLGENGVSVPGLVAAFRKALQAPEHGQYLHWGATSQDIQDSALMLRLGRALTQMQGQLGAILTALAGLAQTHADTPMAARTYGQQATPTSFGAVIAAWGHPIAQSFQDIADLRRDVLLVSLSGAAGTASQLGDDPAALRAALAAKLGLGDPGRSWHSDRTPILKLGDWLTRLCVALGKLGEDLTLASQTEYGEAAPEISGASSTMPQKQNPVAASVLVALARHVTGLNATLQGAGLHRQQRDGAAWFTEWLALPQMVIACAAALTQTDRITATLAADPDAMARNLGLTDGLILAEALGFALAARMPRPDAQAATKSLCAEARATGAPLADLARAAYPDLAPDLFEFASHLGQAPAEAHQFAKRVQSLMAN